MKFQQKQQQDRETKKVEMVGTINHDVGDGKALGSSLGAGKVIYLYLFILFNKEITLIIFYSYRYDRCLIKDVIELKVSIKVIHYNQFYLEVPQLLAQPQQQQREKR